MQRIAENCKALRLTLVTDPVSVEAELALETINQPCVLPWFHIVNVGPAGRPRLPSSLPARSQGASLLCPCTVSLASNLASRLSLVLAQ